MLLILFLFLFVFFMYTFLHESGHAIAGVLFGQSLTEFSVSFWDFSAHVGMAGGDLSETQLAIQAASGAGLPFLMWASFLSCVPRRANFTLEVLKLISSLTVISTLLVWIVLPVLFILGEAPSDDVTHFLVSSHIHPLVVTFTACVLYAAGWAFFLARINGLQSEFLLFRGATREDLTAGMRRGIAVMGSIAASCIALTLTLNHLSPTNSLDEFTPPPGYASVAQLNLSVRTYSTQTITGFTLDETSYVGVFIAVRSIDTSYFDLTVTGPGGFCSTVLHGEGYRADQDGGLWEKHLPPGSYQLILTSHQSPGTLSVYLKAH
jgi:hypothetical protein